MTTLMPGTSPTGTTGFGGGTSRTFTDKKKPKASGKATAPGQVKKSSGAKKAIGKAKGKRKKAGIQPFGGGSSRSF